MNRSHADTALVDRSEHSRQGGFDWRTAGIGVALALAGWALAQVHAHAERLARLEAATEHVDATLVRIEAKVDRLQETTK